MNSDIGLFEHFRLLFTLKGRENRGSFWPYAALVFGILAACNMLLMIPIMMTMGHPFGGDGAPSLPNFGYYFIVMFGIGILLYGAAMIRRLRDSGRSGYWVLMPLPFILASSIGMTMLFQAPFEGNPPDMRLFQMLFVSNGLYMLSLIALVVLLSLPSAAVPGDRPE